MAPFIFFLTLSGKGNRNREKGRDSYTCKERTPEKGGTREGTSPAIWAEPNVRKGRSLRRGLTSKTGAWRQSVPESAKEKRIYSLGPFYGKRQGARGGGHK